jgi:hypothetical protein
MSALDDLVDAKFRPHATGGVAVAIEKAADEFVKEFLRDDHFKRLLQESIDRCAGAMVTEFLSPAEAALTRALGVAVESGMPVSALAGWLRSRADALETGR